jgi:3-oxoacyl-[acyl-carrier-protein] synthase II
MADFTRSTSSTERRVVVTGIGILCPTGITANESWKNILEGVSGIDKITHFDASTYDCQIAGEVKPFSTDNYIEKKELKKMDRFIQMTMVAGQDALKDSGFEINDQNRKKVGCFVGVGIGGLPGIENQHQILMEKGHSRVSPFFIPMVIANMAAGYLSMKVGAQGPSYCITSACSSGAHAIGEAVRYIRAGLADVMIAGGAESAVIPMSIAGFENMRALSTRNDEPKRASRPFDKDRDGFVLSEGSAVLVLESYEAAQKRGAKIYAEISGYGLSSDAYHITSPAPEHVGAQDAMRAALKDARLNTEDIQYINAHGTSTPVGDGLETVAIKHVFKDHAKKLMVSSTKSMTGHLLGAAGALESAFCALSLRDQVVPPTINLENPSPDCDLDYVPKSARNVKLNHVINNSFGFGGTNASVIFSKI